MKRVALLALALLAFRGTFAAPLELLMTPRFGDPTRMTMRDRSGVFDLATSFIEREGVTSLTYIVWMKWNPNGRNAYGNPFVMCHITPDYGRSTLEGGRQLPNVSPSTWANYLTLDNGTWSAPDCLPANYECPATLQSQNWKYGCYCFNVETDSDLTLTIAGAEKNIAASNGVRQIFNIMGETSSRAVAISAASADAHIRFEIAENPLCQFVGGQFDGSGGSGTLMNVSQGGLSSNEWRMIVFSAVITNGVVSTYTRGYNAQGQMPSARRTTDALFRPHTAFSYNSRFRLMVAEAGGIGGLSSHDLPTEHFLVYGFRGYCKWLTEGEILRMYEQDAAELQRRGY